MILYIFICFQCAERDNEYRNIYHNKYGVDVFVFNKYIKWCNDNITDESVLRYDITDIVKNISLFCCSNKTLLYSTEQQDENKKLFKKQKINKLDTKSDIIDNNYLFFYQEFIGNDIIGNEGIIKRMIPNFDFSKICIDITRGTLHNCSINFSELSNYPIIELENNRLRYTSIEGLSYQEKMNIFNEFHVKINLVLDLDNIRLVLFYQISKSVLNYIKMN